MQITGSIETVRGAVAISGTMFSLSDMWVMAGNDLNHPDDWALANNLPVFGEAGVFFAEKHVALAYAKFLSPVLGGSLEAAIGTAVSPFDSYGADALRGVADKSHDTFVNALAAAGVDRSDFGKLTNLLYLHCLNMSARGLRDQRVIDGKCSVRKGLDAKSLAMVLTCEINVASAIYSDRLQGYADVAHKVKQQAALVDSMYRTSQTH